MYFPSPLNHWGWTGSSMRTSLIFLGNGSRRSLLPSTPVKRPSFHLNVLASPWTGPWFFQTMVCFTQKRWFVLPSTLEWQWLTGFYPWFSPVRARVYRVFYDRSKWKWVGPSLRHMLKLFCPLMQLRMTADDLYFLTKTELVLAQCWETSLVCVLCFFCGFTS